jgi:hypothetical protein
VPRLDVKTFRVPGAAALGRDRVVVVRDVWSEGTDDSALCVAGDAGPLPLSAGG